MVGGAPGDSAHCTRCGEGLNIGLPIRIEVWIAATKAFVKAHKDCVPGQYFEKPAVTPEEWARGRDTGVSSLTIYAAITGRDTNMPWNIPYDPSDFGRCYRLLKLFPSWRAQLHKVVGICQEWAPFVQHWDELTKIYEEELPNGGCPKL